MRTNFNKIWKTRSTSKGDIQWTLTLLQYHQQGAQKARQRTQKATTDTTQQYPQDTHEAPKKGRGNKDGERRGINNIVISEMIRTKRFESWEGSKGTRKTHKMGKEDKWKENAFLWAYYSIIYLYSSYKLFPIIQSFICFLWIPYQLQIIYHFSD
jgi:hypothetical protein